MSAITYRNITDADLQVTKYLPAAAANNMSDSFDLGPGLRPENVEVRVDFPASANHTDSSKSVTIDLMESTDNVSFTAVSPSVQISVAGVTSTGSAAATYRIALPPTVARYIAFKQTVPSGDGSLVGDLVTYSLVF